MHAGNVLLLNALRIIWTAATLWFELGVFFHSVRICEWPDSAFLAGPPLPQAPSHVLIIADPQILDHRSYPDRAHFLTYISRLIVDLNLRKNWRAALHKHPDAVVFLGDMMDGGRFLMSADEYENYYLRFKDIFKLDPTIPAYFLPGNHDTGLRAASSFSPYAHSRYVSHFGQLNSQTIIANHTLVFLDAPSFVEEDNKRARREQTYTDWKAVRGGPVEFIKSLAQERTSPTILFSHIPLARNGSDCGPLREKGTIRPGIGFGYQNTLGSRATTFLLENIQPTVVFSGDDHDYCEYHHPVVIHETLSQLREVTVKSFSMAMGIRRPAFQLLSLAPQEYWHNLPERTTHADAPCFLPDQLQIYISVYIPLLVISLLLVFISNALRVRASRHGAHRLSRSPPPAPRLTALAPLRSRSEGENNSDDEESAVDKSLYNLPRPASARKIRAPLTWSFVLLGRRRRITIGTCGLCSNSLLYCLGGGQRMRRQKYRGLVAGFTRDVRDIAVFPLIVFIFISLWITFF